MYFDTGSIQMENPLGHTKILIYRKMDAVNITELLAAV